MYKYFFLILTSFYSLPIMTTAKTLKPEIISSRDPLAESSTLAALQDDLWQAIAVNKIDTTLQIINEIQKINPPALPFIYETTIRHITALLMNQKVSGADFLKQDWKKLIPLLRDATKGKHFPTDIFQKKTDESWPKSSIIKISPPTTEQKKPSDKKSKTPVLVF